MTHISEQFNLEGKVAIITGSSKGIGKAIAKGLAQNGAQVIISSRNQEACNEVVKEFIAEGLKAIGIACHIGKEEQRKDLVDKTVEAFGRIDILVNNAAINPVFGPIEDVDPVIFDKIIDVNVKAPWSLSNLVLPHLKENKNGSIINIASVEALTPGLGLGLYSTSKAAILMLSKNQAKEWGKYGIRVNAICPGLIKTKFSSALWQNEKILGKVEKALPTGRMGMPEEMVGLACLLASNAGNYMTGGVYAADGGYMIAG
ncbi:short-chain dehydrogenase [Polaribacter sp. SA4-10]|uniref:SDR family NAD(P)-dependent oxidoreductase n=1 Tax=Polaribacter sp. SA4-10 TaxID=754397 RepID=UPI000B3D0405|nr:glucose 1-dehydrogenase [Polaribacter sp. SA4-10]ARV07537.1 short-chain dehydrogenase [Polaribacter sp. SA4-10]